MSARIDPSASQLARDALRELVNIGGAHGVTALSRLLGGKRLVVSVPDLVITDAGADLMGRGVLVVLDVRGFFAGHFALVLDASSARSLAASLLGDTDAQVASIGPLEESSLMELGNIMASAFLNAASEMLKFVLMPSPPDIQIGDLRDWISAREAASPQRQLLIGSPFAAEDGSFWGQIMMLVDEDNAIRITERLGLSCDGF